MQKQLLDVLRAEGLTEVEILGVTLPGPTWQDRADGYEEVSFPVMADTRGVFYMYGVEPYETVLVDKKGRLVTKMRFDEEALEPLRQRIRQLHAE